MVRLASEGLRSVGAASPSKSVCSILPLARHLRAGEGSSMLTPARGSLLKPERRANRYNTQTTAREPTTESAASTQKSIARMHSSLSLAVGYNRVVTHGRRPCNNVVAILAKDKTPTLCSKCRTPASILSSAALGGPILQRGLRFAPRLRGCGLFVTMLCGGTRPGEEVRDGPHNNNRGGGNRCGVAPTAAPLRPPAGTLRGSGLYTGLGRAFRTPLGAALALLPLRVAWDRGW